MSVLAANGGIQPATNFSKSIHTYSLTNDCPDMRGTCDLLYPCGRCSLSLHTRTTTSSNTHTLTLTHGAANQARPLSELSHFSCLLRSRVVRNQKGLSENCFLLFLLLQQGWGSAVIDPSSMLLSLFTVTCSPTTWIDRCLSPD